VFSLLRRLISVILTIVTLAVAAVVGYTYMRDMVAVEPIIIEAIDGRPTLTVEQPNTAPQDLDSSWLGLDISYPQCKLSEADALPDGQADFAIIGLNKGKPFTANPCFKEQWSWAKEHAARAIYINTADPGKGDPTAYGTKIAKDTIKRLTKFKVAPGTPIWLDIETLNTWTTPERSNQVIVAALRTIAEAGYPVGVYAPPAHWYEITLNARIDTPLWLALGEYSSLKKGKLAAKAACDRVAFGDQKPDLVQFVTKLEGRKYDHNIICTATTALLTR
jgi:hypothetical protein